MCRMSARLLRPRWKRPAVLVIAMSLSSLAVGQTPVPPSTEEIKAQVDRFQAKAFRRCGDSFISGPFRIETQDPVCGNSKRCELIRETQEAPNARPAFQAQPSQPASNIAAIGMDWLGIIYFNESRTRTRRRINSYMQPWSNWQNVHPPFPFGVRVASLFKQNS